MKSIGHFFARILTLRSLKPNDIRRIALYILRSHALN